MSAWMLDSVVLTDWFCGRSGVAPLVRSTSDSWSVCRSMVASPVAPVSFGANLV